jgi:hypothetical protein
VEIAWEGEDGALNGLGLEMSEKQSDTVTVVGGGCGLAEDLDGFNFGFDL